MRCSSGYRLAGAAFALLLLGHVPLAQASSVGIELGRDRAGGSSVYLDASLDVDERWRLDAALGRDEDDVADTDVSSVGASLELNDRVRAGLRFTRLDQQSDFVSDTVEFDIVIEQDDWRFGLRPALRDVELARSTGGTVSLSARGIGLLLGWFRDRVSLSFQTTRYDYDRNLSAFGSRPVIASLLFSDSVLDQAYGLNESVSVIRGGYLADAFDISISLVRSVSAVNGVTSNSLELGIGIPLQEHWIASLYTGYTVEEDDSEFLAAGLAYWW